MRLTPQNNNSPLVSVVTISFNSEHTIRGTIESVLSQTYTPIEYIIIDGGSTDSTCAIVKGYGERIIHFVSEHDNGISDAFNKGIKLAAGKYLQLINSDDRLHKDKILHSVNLLENNPEYYFTFGDLIKVFKNNAEERIQGDPNYSRSIRFVMNRVNHPTMLVHRELFQEFGLFDSRWKIAMDYDWILRIHAQGRKGIYSPEIVAYTTAGGISDSKRFLAFKECRMISIQHGLHPLLAYSYFLLRCAKHIVLKVLGKR